MYRDSNNSWQSDLRRRFVMAGIPATLTIMGLTIALWFIITISRSMGLFHLLAFDSNRWPIPYPWTIATWPLVDADHPIFLLFALAWAYRSCGSLERSWGTRVFALFFLAVNALTALTLLLGGALLHTSVGLSGLWTGIAAATVAWCLVNRREKLCFWGITISPLWLAGIVALIVWYEAGPPFLGLFALSGCAAAYYYVTQGRNGDRNYGYANSPRSASRSPFSSSTSRPRESDGSGFSLARYLRDRREKRRLEDLFRRSGYDERDQR